MIKNERQFRITRSRADEVRGAISELSATVLPEGLEPQMREMQIEAAPSWPISKPNWANTTPCMTPR